MRSSQLARLRPRASAASVQRAVQVDRAQTRSAQPRRKLPALPALRTRRRAAAPGRFRSPVRAAVRRSHASSTTVRRSRSSTSSTGTAGSTRTAMAEHGLRRRSTSMTNQIARLYASSSTCVVFFLAWAAVAAHPWAAGRRRSIRASSALATPAAAPATRGRAGQAGRRPALGRLPRRARPPASRDQAGEHRSSGRGEPGASSGSGRLGTDSRSRRGAAGPGRHPSPARHHQDLVMQKHVFHAMGTTFELVLEADDADEALRQPPKPSSSASSRSCRAFARRPSSPA